MKQQTTHDEKVATDEDRQHGADPLLMMTVALGFALICMAGVMMFS